MSEPLGDQCIRSSLAINIRRKNRFLTEAMVKVIYLVR